MGATLKGPQGSFELSSSVVNVGRSPVNELILDDHEVSWFHAQICPQEQSYTVVDLGSTNHTFVNEQMLLPRTPHRLTGGETVRFGGTTFSYMTDASKHIPTKVADPMPMPTIADSQPKKFHTHLAAPFGQAQGRQRVRACFPLSGSRKFRYKSNKEKATYIAAIIGAAAAIIASLIGGIFVLIANPPNREAVASSGSHSPTITSSPTPTPVPSSTAYPPSGWQPHFSEPLKSNSSGYWPEGSDSRGTCSFTGNAYQVSASTKGKPEDCITPQYHLSDFALEVQMTIVKGDEGGIDFRSSDDVGGSTYYFWITAEGTYGFEIWENSSLYEVLSTGSSPAINTVYNRTNLIAVVAQGNTFHLYAHKQLIATVTDKENSYSRGYIGFNAFPINKPTQALFSNLKVWTPSF